MLASTLTAWLDHHLYDDQWVSAAHADLTWFKHICIHHTRAPEVTDHEQCQLLHERPDVGASYLCAVRNHVHQTLLQCHTRSLHEQQLYDTFAQRVSNLLWTHGAHATRHYEASFLRTYANAMLSDSTSPIEVGLFYLSPHAHYPRHHHRERELYHVLYGGVRITNTDPVTGAVTHVHLRAHEWHYHAPFVQHALHTGVAHTLVLWFREAGARRQACNDAEGACWV